MLNVWCDHRTSLSQLCWYVWYCSGSMSNPTPTVGRCWCISVSVVVYWLKASELCCVPCRRVSRKWPVSACITALITLHPPYHQSSISTADLVPTMPPSPPHSHLDNDNWAVIYIMLGACLEYVSVVGTSCCTLTFLVNESWLRAYVLYLNYAKCTNLIKLLLYFKKVLSY